MKKIGAAFENFAFKTFDLSGRATPLEYWVVMPTIWAIIAFLLYGDAVEFWGMLLAKQVPTLNPLYWDGILVFLLTFIPRFSLTVRRLHDSGKSGKWVKLPFVTVSSSFYLLLASIAAMASMATMNDDFVGSIGVIGVIMAVAFGSVDSAWDAIFAGAAMLNALGWDAIWALLSEMTSSAPKVSMSQGIEAMSDGLQSDPVTSSAIMLMMLILIATPFVTASLHLFFMISPTKPDHDLDLAGPISGASLRKKGDVSDNPFAGYKHLYEKTPEQKAAAAAHAKQEIKTLYQQRVLGSQ